MQGTLCLPSAPSKRQPKVIEGLLNRVPRAKEAVETVETIATSGLPFGKKASLLLSFFIFFALSMTSAWAYQEPDDTSKFKFIYDVAVNDFWASVAIIIGLVMFIAGVVALAFTSLKSSTAGIAICAVFILAGALMAGAVGYVKKLGCLAI